MSHGASKVILCVYPGESRNGLGQLVGHIYVNDGPERFDVAGGPPTSSPIVDMGGHTATRTPPGRYVLDQAEHHTTQGWPNSVVPWGARLREVAEIVQFELNGRWVDASGPKGRVTSALLIYFIKSKRPISPGSASRRARQMFYDDAGVPMTRWSRNDFGNWSWNMKQNGRRTAFFIHTTPQDEAAGNKSFELQQSHGCLHIRPKDRDSMVRKGYLAAGISVVVKPYTERWRP
jgi:hypothetical protein